MNEHGLLIWVIALVAWGSVLAFVMLALSIVLVIYGLKYMRQFSLVAELLGRQQSQSLEDYVQSAEADAYASGRVPGKTAPENEPPVQPGEPGYTIGTPASHKPETDGFPT